MNPWQLKRLLVGTGIVAVVLFLSFSIHPVSTARRELSQTQRLIVTDDPSEVVRLEKMNVNKAKITLSGFSAGASMAIQAHLSHSSLFSGIAIFSQVFYHCGHRSLIEFGIRCSTTGLQIFPYRVTSSVSDAKEYERQGLIDPLSNLSTQKIFIWTGELDIYIPSGMAKKNVEFYKAVGANPDNIKFLLFNNATHLIPTQDYGPDCDQDAGNSYYLGDCNYKGAYHALSHVIGEHLGEATPDPAQLKLYNQSEFYPGNIRDVAMGQVGYIYTPKRCQDSECLLHLNFHGCNEWPPDVAKEYILNSGFLSVAEGTGIILIFPLTTKVPQNMDGCWDFYSYTGPNFATKKGAQIQVIERLLNRILKGE